MTEYFNKQGKKADEKEAAAETIVDFANDRMTIKVIFNGKLDDGENYFPRNRPLFTAHVHNWTGKSWVSDAVEHEKTFPNEKMAHKWYQEFLMDWSDSYYDDEGEFVEVGNKLTPPKPADPNKPMSRIESAW